MTDVPTSAVLLAVIVAAVLLIIAAIHVYWAAGGTWGASAAVPTRAHAGGADSPLFTPGRASTLAVAAGLIVAAVLVLGRVGAVSRIAPTWTYRYGAWAIGAIFLLRAIGEFRYVGMFKRVRGTRFATMDTRLFSPLCAAIAMAVLYIAAS